MNRIIFLLLAAAISGVANAESDPLKQGFDLTKLRMFYESNDRDHDEKMKQLVDYLREERAKPSPPGMGPGGGPVDSVYVQHVIISVIVQTVPQESILKAARREQDRKMKELIVLALSAAGNRDFAKDVEAALQPDSDILSRLLGVQAVARFKSADALPLLERMRADPYSRLAIQGDGYYKIYPIRALAREATVRLGGEKNNWVVGVPLRANCGETVALASLLDDGDPEQCVSVLRMLEKRSSADVKDIIEKFVIQNATKAHLARSVEIARQILKKLER